MLSDSENSAAEPAGAEPAAAEPTAATRRAFLRQLAATSASAAAFATAGGSLFALVGCASPRPLAHQPGTLPSPADARFARLPDRPPEERSAVVEASRRTAPLELLPVPDLSEAVLRDPLVRSVAGLRPYRRGGVRLELDRLPDRRPIVHNYGHGGAGITLAWGCAEEVRDLLAPALAPPAAVAVLGAGIIGMTVASVLAERGYSVTIFADKFTPDTTSDLAGGQFAPSLVAADRGQERQHRMERILRRSYARYAAQVGGRFGVYRRPNYATPGHGTGLTRIPAGLFPPIRRLPELPFPGPPRRGRVHQTLLIEPPTYLPRLTLDLDERGVDRVRRRFASVGECARLPQQGIVDCLGLGARDLFDDRSVVPIRGQLLLLPPQPLRYLLSHRGYLFSRSDALVLGGTAEWHAEEARTEPRALARIVSIHRQFFQSSASTRPVPSTAVPSSSAPSTLESP